MARLRWILPVLAVTFLAALPARGAGYRPVAGLIDLRTRFSDGQLDPESLACLARKRGFRVLFINDHDRMAMEYGIPPLRHLIRKRVERNSINKGGAAAYLSALRRVAEKHPDMVIIPGSETAPFYYWTGSYLKGTLTAHDHEKRLLVIGLERPEDYRDLPILHNGFSTRYVTAALPFLLMFLAAFLLGIALLRGRGRARASGIGLCVLSLLFMINTDPFRSSPFDPYHGDRGIAPYQLLIDYVNARGGLVFWNYPETRSGRRKMGPIFVDTPPHPGVLAQSRGYTGFAALYGDTISVTEPGNLWDWILMEYCNGQRARPVWGISTADFHGDGESGEKLGNFVTVFWVPELSKQAILFAMRHGRMYACRGKYPQRIILDAFSVSGPGCVTPAISGEEIRLRGDPVIHISLSSKIPAKKPVRVRLIRSGEVIQAFRATLPMVIDYRDAAYRPGRKIYYRIDVRGDGALVSNPVFVTFRPPGRPT
ncbi:MAG: hypothetical protein DRH56_05795 [Deltaproteobacteria bacterium]|nr:MAG: hypothetical protein DRH56_05795 [Deltaproteobacteria bacterium]